MERELKAHGLFLLSEALTRLENSNVDSLTKVDGQKTTKQDGPQNSNWVEFRRGKLRNEEDSLLSFFYWFGLEIKTPLVYYVDTVDDRGKLSNIKTFKALPVSFLRLAAALVVHYR